MWGPHCYCCFTSIYEHEKMGTVVHSLDHSCWVKCRELSEFSNLWLVLLSVEKPVISGYSETGLRSAPELCSQPRCVTRDPVTKEKVSLFFFFFFKAVVLTTAREPSILLVVAPEWGGTLEVNAVCWLVHDPVCPFFFFFSSFQMPFNGFVVCQVKALSVVVVCCDHTVLVHMERDRMSVVVNSDVMWCMSQPLITICSMQKPTVYSSGPWTWIWMFCTKSSIFGGISSLLN